MGKKEEKSITGKVAIELLKACAQTLGIIFAGSIGSYIAAALVTTINPIAGIALFCVGAGVTSVFTYRRTVILGEVTIEYVLNDCSWGIEGQDAVIRRCAKRAEDYYFYIKNKQKPSNSKQEPEDSPSASALAR